MTQTVRTAQVPSEKYNTDALSDFPFPVQFAMRLYLHTYCGFSEIAKDWPFRKTLLNKNRNKNSKLNLNCLMLFLTGSICFFFYFSSKWLLLHVVTWYSCYPFYLLGCQLRSKVKLQLNHSLIIIATCLPSEILDCYIQELGSLFFAWARNIIKKFVSKPSYFW